MTHSALATNNLFASLSLPQSKAAAALVIGAMSAVIASIIGAPETIPWSLALALGLSWASAVDLDRFILPDVLTFGLLACGLARATTGGIAEALPYLIGAASGYFALAAVAAIYKRVRGRAGLGMGDAKLLAVAGAWLGWTFLPFVLLLASICCLVIVAGHAALRRTGIPDGPVPFGPYLALAIWGLWLVQIGSRF